ncbi:MAG: hypothetical protein L0H54_09445 [Alcaligenaceae bacterium]|nr:hypothetical protein [Alcaligenaceae bacterium]
MAAMIMWLLLVLPPVQQALQASMIMLMLVQIPLLVCVGYLLGRWMPSRFLQSFERWDEGGVTGLVLASLATLAWMLPRVLDASINSPWVALAKFVTVPLLIGLPLGLSWPRAGFVARGVVMLELVASCFRIGWLYLISPERLCSNYLLDDQQRLGRALLIIGVVLVLAIAWKLLFGHFKRKPLHPNSGRSGASHF